jgi:hypothetical protein
LRERARHVLQKANLGTSAAIEQAVRSLGIAQVTVREDAQKPGTVDVVLGDPDISPELLNQAKAAVQEVRPAGIQVSVLVSDRVFVQIAATLMLREDFPEERKKAISGQITQALQSYFDSLKTGELVRWTKISALLTGPEEVAELQPLSQGYAFLSPFVLEDGKPKDVGSNYRANNGDVRIGANERAALDLTAKPLLLSLEPPALDVWVDVAFGEALTPDEEKELRSSLQTQLDTFKPVRAVAYKDLKGVLQGKSVASFTFIHQKDGLTVILKQAEDSDQLKERERFQVGEIDYPGKQNG